MKDFIKWFLDTQLVKSKAPVWRDFFMNAMTLILIHVFSYQVLTGQKVSNEFMMLLSMVLGFYFNHKSSDKPTDKD
jgi:hypothetical protein